MKNISWPMAVGIGALGLGLGYWLARPAGSPSATDTAASTPPSPRAGPSTPSGGPDEQAAAKGVAAEPPPKAGRDAERARAREVADAVRRHAARRRAADEAAGKVARAPGSGGAAELAAAGGAPSTGALPPASAAEGRRDYIQRTVREQYFPVARDCYQELLGRQPTARGKVVLEFAIVGDGDAGVVDRVALRDDTTFDDPEFTLCMRESMYTAVFEPPPPGASETTIVYPIELTPD